MQLSDIQEGACNRRGVFYQATVTSGGGVVIPKHKYVCGMLSSLQTWNPSIPLSILVLHKACGLKGKVVLSPEIKQEYQHVSQLIPAEIDSIK